MREVAPGRRTRVSATQIVTVLVSIMVSAGILALLNRFEDSAVFIISASIVMVSCLLMQHLVGVFNLRRITIPGFWYLTYVMMVFVPSFFVFLAEEGASRYRYLLAVNSVMLTVPLGMLIVNTIFRFRKREIVEYFRTCVVGERTDTPAFSAWLLGFGAAVLLVVAYTREVEVIPLFYLIGHVGDYERLVLLREESFKLLDSRLTYIWYLVRVFGFPMLILVALGYYLVTRRRRWLMGFVAALVAGLLYAGMSLAKLPVAGIPLLISLFVYLYRSGSVSRITMTMAAVVLFAIPVVMVMAISGIEVGLSGAVWAIAKRLLYEPAEVLYWYFALFPGEVGYLHGRSIGKLSWLLGWEYFDTPNYVGLYGIGSRIGSVNANAAFIGDLNADFGIFGVLVGGVLAGGLMHGVQVHLVRRRKTVVSLSVYTYLMFAFWLLHSTSLPVVLASNAVLLTLAFPWAFRVAKSVLLGYKNRLRYGT